MDAKHLSPRVGFVTCVQLGLSCMEEIASLGGRLDAVLTLPDDRAVTKAGRAFVDAYCHRYGVSIGKFRNINDPDAVEWLRAQSLDWLFIIGWSQVAGPSVLGSARFGAIGMHPSLLPHGRGRAAIAWAILKGLRETGVSMFVLDAGIDTGPLLDQVRIAVDSRETAETLYEKVAHAHVRLMREAWPKLLAGRLESKPQNEKLATVWPARRPEDGRITSTMTVVEADTLVRAATRPYPGAFFDEGDVRWRVWSATPATSFNGEAVIHRLDLIDGALLVTEGQQEVVN